MASREGPLSMTGAGRGAGAPIVSILATAKAVITEPTQFYRGMPKSGGFAEPLTFVVVMAAVSAVVGVGLAMFGLGLAPTLGGALVSVILMPVVAAIVGFVAAAVLFVAWRLLGSRESYETAYRCGAYMTAISPIAALVNVIPYLGVLVTLGWSLYLVLVASEHVHELAPATARLAFGILFALFALTAVGSQMRARRLQAQVESWNERMEKMEEMTPEQAGKAVGELLEGLRKSVEPESENAR